MGFSELFLTEGAISRGFWRENRRVIVHPRMEPESTTARTFRPSSSWWYEANPPPPVGSYPNRFSPAVSVLAALFLVAALSAVVWLSASIPKLERVESPERALTLMVGRTMDVQEGLKRAPAWQQALFGWISGDNELERVQAIEWLQELAEISDDPLVPLQLAVLKAESGRVSQALLLAHEWSQAGGPPPQLAALVVAAYGDGSVSGGETFDVLQAELAELVPAGWFYDRLAERLAQRANNEALLATIRDAYTARVDRQFSRARAITVVELAAMIVGTIVLVIFWVTRARVPNVVRLHEPGVPPPWPGGIGAAVLLRGGAIGAMLTVVFLLYMPQENASLRALAIPLTNLPLLLLAYQYLFKPAQMTFDQGFGLEIGWARAGRLVAAVMAVVAAGLWGEWTMDRVAEPLQLTNHWTEWFDADLVWGPSSLTAISLIEYVAFAPVFEELVFRGLLFAILRRKFRFLPAALMSASIFAIAHGYGLVGFISVLWSGLLWAWIYQKTGSLLPGILAHALNNLLVCLSVMALLRW
jgi:membrane protease YdiL (CAAX protease family)